VATGPAAPAFTPSDPDGALSERNHRALSEPTPTSPPPSGSPDSAVTAARRVALNEDWAATIVGLLLLALGLTGLLPGWLVP
jgi:hypothetical protein